MKLAPLSILYALADHKQQQQEAQQKQQEQNSASQLTIEQRVKDIDAITRMTHSSVEAIVTAIIYNFFIEDIVSLVVLKNHAALDLTLRKQILERTLANSLHYEKQYAQVTLPNENSLMSARLQELLTLLNKHGAEGVCDDDLIRISNGGDFKCFNSLTMVIGLVLCSSEAQKLSFDTIVRAALIGGDTDSNASMVGAVVGLVCGKEVIPQDYINALYGHDSIAKLAAQFADCCCAKF